MSEKITVVYVYGPFGRVWAEEPPLKLSWIKEYMFIYSQTYYENHWILRIFYRIVWILFFNTCSYGELFTGVSPIGCGGAMVWCVQLTFSFRIRIWIPPTPGTCVLQQDTLSTLLLSTQVYKWVPGRMRTLFVAWFGMYAPLKWRLARMLLRELRRCTMSAGLILNPMTGVIIHCKTLWVVYHTKKALYF